MLIIFRQDVIDLKPTVVIILAGINDIAQNTGPSSIKMIKNNIFSMAELAKINNIQVILCSVLPAKKFPWAPTIEPSPITMELNQRIKNYAEQNEITYVNYFDAMKNSSNGMKRQLADDGIHPNSKGYQIMEEILKKEIITLSKR